MGNNKYIKGKDGKFAGSIGAGKTNVPTSIGEVKLTTDQPKQLEAVTNTQSDISRYSENFMALQTPVAKKTLKVFSLRYEKNGIPANSLVDILSEKTNSDGKRIFHVETLDGKTLDVEEDQLEEIDPNKIGDDHANKVCNICDRCLPIANFDNNRSKKGKTTRRPSCKDCRQKIDGIPLSKSKKDEMEEFRPNDFEKWQCPACERWFRPGITCQTNLDHDHETGEARGWICANCNTGLGKFQDNVEVLKKQIKYLEGNKVIRKQQGD